MTEINNLQPVSLVNAVRQDYVIPPDDAVRKAIHDAARSYARRMRLVPPLPLESLKNHADVLRRELSLDGDSAPFTILMLNNAVWEPLYARIPRNKRLLLLPFCLRNPEDCPATYDDLGLLCADCGRCSIPDWTLEAEKTGMNVLVAESSSSVSEWIETGEIQAVVGVSCLESLTKAFPAMTRHAVPGLAVPLLRGGCKNTSFDLEFLREILRQEETPPLIQDFLTPLQNRMDRLFSEETLRRYLRLDTAALPAFSGEILRVLSRHGKHYRPKIACGTYAALTNQSEFPDFLDPIALAIETFHKASLLHDDIEDEDETRYGEATTHRRFGIAVALNAGDFLVGEGYRLLGHDSIPIEIRSELLREAARGHGELALGQAREFERPTLPVSLVETLETARLKTAPAFRVALALGAIAAGKFDSYREIFARFADSLGVTYQLGDDLADDLAGEEAGNLADGFSGENGVDENRSDIRKKNASSVDCLIAAEKTTRQEARTRIKSLYEKGRAETLDVLEKLTDPVLKIFLTRLTWKVLGDD